MSEQTLSVLQKAILQLVKSNGRMTRRQICDTLGRAWTTVYDHITPLVYEYLMLIKVDIQINRYGRPTTYYKLRQKDV